VNRLTPEQFKALAKLRGYRLSDLAARWELSRARLSQVAADTERAPIFDEALWALPPKRLLKLAEGRRQTILATLTQSDIRETKKIIAAQYWEDITEIGWTYIVEVEQGDHLAEGMEGIVTGRNLKDNQPTVTITFESGHVETYPLQYLKSPECFIASRGFHEAKRPPNSR
jgi:hypothetical protein